ncbi:ABC transporter substrate-binding protein [Streptomyces sp. SHP 1-2]|uniref:ABC transporter substrate-binding protein n=1 Tax=Streptomyces sp. SHP 1-2 TaxID=2769489 RepID=UPI002237FD8F|nr:ABC transporter substrate-binding protein [Streptomyces sp. SHP 1-2]
MSELLTLTRPQGANRALLDGTVTPAGHTLRFADEPVLVKGFRRMVRGLEYDVAEMALTTYLTAREHGVAFTALPVFLVRAFHHGATQVLADSPVGTPADLAGKRVGVNRGYTVTTGVWGRSFLQEAGLDPDDVTWVCTDEEHVADYVRPANVTAAPDGVPLEELLLTGAVDAVVGAAIEHPSVVPLIADPEEAGLRAAVEDGIFPVNHLVVVRDELLAGQPGLAEALFEAFTGAKERYVGELRAGLRETAQDRTLGGLLDATGRDPLPYGIEPNRAVLERLLADARAQHILRRTERIEDVFAPGTLALTG